jgi:MSHA type pilus biogenesis protein MshL
MEFMQSNTDFSSWRSRKYLPALVCLILGLTADLSQGQAVQSPPPIQQGKADSPDGEKRTPRFTLNVKDVNLREALLLLNRNSAYSLIMEPGIDTAIPVLDLKNVTMAEALQSILPGLGLEYRLEGNVLKVNKLRMQTRLFNMDYIAASRSGKRDMRMSSRSESGGSGSSGGNGGSGSASGGGSSGSSGGSSSENQSTVITTNTSEVWTDLRLGLENIIFSGDMPGTAARQEDKGPVTTTSRDASGRRLLINPQAGVIMIQAESSILDEAAGYIEAVEGSIQRQVLIEARVVEVSLSKDHQMGIDWAAILNPASSFAGQNTNSLGVTNPSIGFNSGSALNQNVNGSVGSFLYSISNGKVGMTINALSRQGQVRVLSSPHISAMNNQKAVIRVVREEVFFTQTSLSSQSVGSTLTTENIENQIVPIGVVLDIIPQIAANGEITLSINPSISELVEIRSFSSKGGTATSTQPVIDRRDLDTVAKVHSGETVLIAGIMRERKGEDLRGVPWLMNLPFVGNVFRRTEQTSSRTELVIFITPTLISGKSMDELIKERNKKLLEMEQPFKLGTVEPIKQGIKGEMGRK